MQIPLSTCFSCIDSDTHAFQHMITMEYETLYIILSLLIARFGLGFA